MLLRKYPDAGMKTMLSPSSTLVSSPPVVRHVESVKKRRRFCGKGNSNKAKRDENSAEPPVSHSSSGSPSAQTSEPPDFALLYYTLVLDDAIPVGYLREFMSLETPASRAAKRGIDLSSIDHRFDGLHCLVCISSRSWSTGH